MELTCENDKLYGPGIEVCTVEKITAPFNRLVKLSDGFDIKYSSIVELAGIAYNLVKDVKDSRKGPFKTIY